jgi:valyl-tRNA synthetase
VKCDAMAESAKEAVRSGELKIIPEHHTKIWFHWMDNIRLVEERTQRESCCFQDTI